MSREFWKEVQRRTERKIHTVMSAEGRNPLAQTVEFGKLSYIPHNHGKTARLIKRYDAPIVIIAKLEHGSIWILQEDGTPCLSSDNPMMREAHWHLSSILLKTRKHIPKWWMVAGFWTVNARSEIYDLPSPFQVFEVGNGEGYTEPYEDLRAWCDTIGLTVCPTLEIPPKDHEGKEIKCVLHLSNDLGFVEQRAIVGGEYKNPARYRTNNMPHGLIQKHIPQPMYAKCGATKLYLKHMGLPH